MAVKAGTVSALLAVVKGVPGDAAAVTGSLAALRKLMANADLRAALLAADGCEALLAVLKAPGQVGTVDCSAHTLESWLYRAFFCA